MAPTLNHTPQMTFWLGRAGSGKTYACLASVADLLLEQRRGALLVLLVPDQMTAQTERRLAELLGPRAGFTRARVYSFTHLAREALSALGGEPTNLLRGAGRIMLLRRALRNIKTQLQVFRTSADSPGFAECLSETLNEFENYGWTADALEEWCDHLPPAERASRHLLDAKLCDLALLWREYQALLAASGLRDPLERHAAVVQAIRHWPLLEGAQVWVDGFFTFTGQELEILEALGQQAESMVLTLTLDPQAATVKATDEPRRPRVGAERIFENIELVYYQLNDRFGELGWLCTALAYPLEGWPERFSGNPVLAHVEQQILTQLKPGRLPDALWPGEAGTGDYPLDAEPLELIEAEDRRAEVEAVARRIVALCRVNSGEKTPTLRWREVGVLARDMAPYAGLVREVFGQFGVPYFLDRPEEMRGHPLSRLMVTTLGVLRSDFGGQAVRALLKTGLAGLRDEDAIGRLENLILATDPEGNAWREASGERMEAAAVLERWNEAAVPLVRLHNQLRQGGAPGPALWDYLTEIQAATTLEEWIREERKAGREAQAQIHEQAWKQLVDWLEDLDRLFGATTGEAGRPAKRSVAECQELLGELSDLVESALAATRARLIPPTLDQVTVGTVERSRLSDCALVFVLGLNLGELPRFWTPDPVLGDEERTALGAEGRGRRRLGPTSRHKRLQEQFLAYMALTRARRKLVLSRPLKMEDGKASEPSPLFTLLADHVPQVPRRQVRRGGQGTGDHAALPLRAEEWALRLSMAASDLGTAEQLQTLAGLLRAGDPLDHVDLTPQVRERLTAGRRRLVEPPVTGIEPALAREYWRDHHPVAITALERLAACPYQFFARDMLHLQERESADLSAMDLGKLRHGLLEHLFKTLNDGTGVDWSAIDLRQIDQLIEAWLAGLVQDRQWAARFRRASLASVALSGAARDLKFFMRAMRLMGQRSALRQMQAEWQFGMEREFVLATPELSFRLRGTVDRIDEATGAEPPALILIDYKSGQRALNVSRLAHGLELQLPLYAAALRRSWAAQKSDLFRIGGFFYWPLTLPILDADDTPALEGDEQAGLEAWLRERPLVGWFEQDLHPLLDNGADGSGAVAFKFKRNKDGRLREASYAPHWPTGMLTQFVARQEVVVAQLLSGVARGDFAPVPFRLKAQTACDYCELAGLCRRREPRVCKPRELEIITRADLLAQLGDAAGGGGT